MQVAADDRADLGVALDHGGERLAVGGAHDHAVPVGHAGDERGLVHGDDRRLLGRARELGLEPLELRRREVAAVLAGDRRVDDD